MAETRKGEVTFKGNPVELVGPKLKAGDKAPDFSCVGAGLEVVNLADTAGKARLFNVVPSLDTPVCNKQTRKFARSCRRSATRSPPTPSASTCRSPSSAGAPRRRSRTSRTSPTSTTTASASTTAS